MDVFQNASSPGNLNPLESALVLGVNLEEPPNMSGRISLPMDKSTSRQWSLVRNLTGLRAKMLISFGLLSAMTLVLINVVRTFGIPFTTYSGAYGDETSQTLRHLDLVADLKQDRLFLWFEERKDDVHTLSRNPTILAGVPDVRKEMQEGHAQWRKGDELRTDLSRHEAYQAILQRLSLVEGTHRVYCKIHLVDIQTGSVLVSTNENEVGLDLSREPYFPAADKLRHDMSINVAEDPSNGRSYIVFAEAVTEGAAADQGSTAVMMFVDMDAFAGPLHHTGEALGESGEVLLVDENSTILIPLKHLLPDGTVPRVLKTRIEAGPVGRKRGNKGGAFSEKDYRGVPVLGAYRTIQVNPGMKWAMVVKVDQAEAFAKLRRRSLITVLLSLVGLLAAGGLATLIAARISRPIENLSRIAQKVASGDLSARAQVEGSKEVEVLSETFNSMIERIETWHQQLDDQVFDLSVLHNVSTALVSTVDLDELLSTLIAEVNKALLAEAGET